MTLHPIDLTIMVVYLLAMIAIGVILYRRASKNLDSYFLGENSLPWYVLGVSNASAMWDITGTMWFVYNIFVYGLKGAWMPWLWPIFNQVFLMIYLASWIRRSNVLTGAAWMSTRFGHGRGAELSRIIIVVFALISVVAFIAYDFEGLGKFSSVFLPWDLSPNTYALIIMAITAVYVIMGGMLSVVITDVAQFIIMGICSVFIALIAMSRVSAETINSLVPAGWHDLFFGWRLQLDWSQQIPAINERIIDDGYILFAPFFMAMLLKGFLVSIAGPAPNYDMQRVLAAKTPKEASFMSAIVSIALMPRWLMVGGITVLGLAFLSPQFKTQSDIDFEMILPYVINNFIPVGLVGLLLAGLLAAFMSTFSATLNAGSAYIVNDLYKRYVRTDASPRHYVIASYISPLFILAAGIGVGLVISSINQVTQWIVSGLFGGYTAPNVLKWHWHRLNGYGYFWGMLTGIAASLVMPVLFPGLHPLHGFPVILVLSAIASIIGSYLTEPEDFAVLKEFYIRVRPWGFWKPVYERVMRENPEVKPNRNCARDLLNSAVATVWQFTLVLMPIYLIIRDMRGLWITLAVLLVTSYFLKKNWLDKFEDLEYEIRPEVDRVPKARAKAEIVGK
jgi:solute:Na+ symporter, SSS family